MKQLLRKRGDPYLALLAYRATSLQCGFSPAELLMSRMLRTTVPHHKESPYPSSAGKTRVREKDRQLKSRQERNFNKRHRARPLPDLDQGGHVWIPDRNSEGEMVGQANSRSYRVVTPEGEYRRNRTALRPLPHGEDRKASHHPESASPDSQQDAAPTERPIPENDETVQPTE